MTCPPTAPVVEARGEGLSLEELSRRQDHYTLLNVALSRQAADPTDAALALLICRSYSALGLAGPAREALNGPALSLAGRSEVQEILRQLATVPTGRVSWRSLQSRFEANSTRTHRRHPHVRQFDPLFCEIPRRLELFQSSDGNLHVSQRGDDGRRTWIPGLFDLNGMVAKIELPHQAKGETLYCQPYLVVSDHFGALLRRVYRGTSKMLLNFAPRIYLLEPDPTALGLLLYTSDDVDALCHERTTLLVGPGCVAELASILEEHPERAPPEYLVRLPTVRGPMAEDVPEAVREVAAVQADRSRAVIERVRDQYMRLPGGHWRRRFDEAAGGGLRVLSMTSRFTTVLQYAVRDLKAAFEALGHRFELLIEPNDHDLITTWDMAGMLDAFQPDLIVVIDHLRGEYAHCIPPKVPYVCWIQDQLPHLMRPEAGRSHGPLDFYVAPELSQFVRTYEYPPDRGMSWTMATNEEVYSAAPLPESRLSPHRCDFSFVSNQSALPEEFHARLRCQMEATPRGQQLLDHLFDMLRAGADERHPPCCRSAMQLLAQAREEIGIAPSTTRLMDQVARRYLHPIAELIFRQQALAWVADYCDQTGRALHVYGTGWESHPRFARYARGVVSNGQVLRAVYQASRINLQIIGSGAVHQRLLDGLAAGGFFLIRSCPIDVLNDPSERLLSAMRLAGAAPGDWLDEARSPQIAAALSELRPILTEPAVPGRARITAGDFASLEAHAADGYRRVARAVFDRYDDVSFGGTAEFRRLADRFLASDEERARISAEMRRQVLARFTFKALVRDLVEFIRARVE